MRGLEAVVGCPPDAVSDIVAFAASAGAEVPRAVIERKAADGDLYVTYEDDRVGGFVIVDDLSAAGPAIGPLTEAARSIGLHPDRIRHTVALVVAEDLAGAGRDLLLTQAALSRVGADGGNGLFLSAPALASQEVLQQIICLGYEPMSKYEVDGEARFLFLQPVIQTRYVWPVRPAENETETEAA